MEGDSKICLDALSKAEEPSNWSISSITWDAAVLNVFFDNCKFCWVKRSLNSAGHSATKYTISLKVGFLCDKHDLPPHVVLLSLMNWLVIKKKKEKC